MKKDTLYLLLSLVSTVCSVILLAKWEGMISWLLFYLVATVFVVMFFRQVERLRIFDKYNGSYDFFNDFSPDGTSIFRFRNKGFYVSYFGKADFIAWEDIKEITTYTTEFDENRTRFLEVITDVKTYRFHEETEGLDHLQFQIPDRLSVIDKGWNTRSTATCPGDGKIILFKQGSATKSG